MPRECTKSSLDLANKVTHRRTSDYRGAALCAQATFNVVGLISLIAGKRDRDNPEPDLKHAGAISSRLTAPASPQTGFCLQSPLAHVFLVVVRTIPTWRRAARLSTLEARPHCLPDAAQPPVNSPGLGARITSPRGVTNEDSQ